MTKGRLRRAAGRALLGAVCFALSGSGAGLADEEPEVTSPRRIEGAWLLSDSRIDGWRYLTRYDISVTGNRFLAVGELILTSPLGLTKSYPPTVSEFSGTIEGGLLRGEVSIDWRSRFENGVTATRPMRGSVDFERGEIAIQYSGPMPDGVSGTKVERWQDSDQTLTLRLIGPGRRQPRQME